MVIYIAMNWNNNNAIDSEQWLIQDKTNSKTKFRKCSQQWILGNKQFTISCNKTQLTLTFYTSNMKLSRIMANEMFVKFDPKSSFCQVCLTRQWIWNITVWHDRPLIGSSC